MRCDMVCAVRMCQWMVCAVSGVRMMCDMSGVFCEDGDCSVDCV